MASGHFKKTLLAGAAAFLYGTGAYAQDVCDIPGIESADPVAVTGGVKDQRTGANLKGALVEIEETGQKSSTDDLGNFRFSSVKPGCYTLRISYLGYRDIEASIRVEPGRRYDDTFAMVGGSDRDVVVVYGSRSARAQALNQERTAENVSTVISGDLLGDFTGTTLAESLRRAPGVVFERDTDTGDGTNIVIRGLEPDLNTVKLNGVELPEGSGTGRSASLSNILTESISKVTISKTLLPNQDSSGTGGLIEIETKTPLDRPHRYASFTLEGAKRGNHFNREFLAAGTVSGTFGANEQFGLSASVQYRDRELKQLNYKILTNFGQYLPLRADGTPFANPLYIDPRVSFPFEGGGDEVIPYGYITHRDEFDTKNLGITLNGAWAFAEHTTLLFDYQKLNQNDNGYTAEQSLQASTRYALHEIAALGGEERYALEWRNNMRLTSAPLYSFKPEDKTRTNVYSLRGKTEDGPLRLQYSAGYARGTTYRQEYKLAARLVTSIGASLLLPEATHPVENRIISPIPIRDPYENTFPPFLLTNAGFDLINDPNLYTYAGGFNEITNGDNSRLNFQLNARYDLQFTPLKYIEAGVDYERAKFSNEYPLIEYAAVGTHYLSEFGLEFGQATLSEVGLNTGYLQITRPALEKFFLVDLASMAVDLDLNDPSTYSPPTIIYRNNPYEIPPYTQLSDQLTRENELAAYIQGGMEFGNLEVIGGVRMTQVDIHARYLFGPSIYDENFVPDFEFTAANTMLVEEAVTQRKFLPRVLANYRLGENIVFRAGYYLSVARPQISFLSSTASAQLVLRDEYGPNDDQYSLQISKGNPDLEPARTHSFDASAELYDSDIGVIKVGGFYKRIENLLESNVTTGAGALADAIAILPEDPRFQDVVINPDDYYVQVTIPQNNESPAKIWGVEVALEKQFTFLPSIWRGIGLYSNYTYTNSSKNQPVNWSLSPIEDNAGNIIGFEPVTIVVPGVRFAGQAKHSGTLGLSYNQYGIDANLAYTMQSRRQTSFQSWNLSAFEEKYNTLDFRFEYNLGSEFGNFRVYLEGVDLTRDTNDPSIETSRGADDSVTAKYYDGGRYFGGRQFRLGLSATF